MHNLRLHVSTIRGRKGEERAWQGVYLSVSFVEVCVFLTGELLC